MNTKNPFLLEQKRAELADRKKYRELLATYSTKYPEIPDQNTAKMWDYLNVDKRVEQAKNPMEVTRIQYISKLIKGKDFHLLNIGFGSANLEREYFKKNVLGKTFWKAFDISEKSVKNAKKKFPQCHFELGNILKIKEKARLFDYVVCLEVLEHISPSKVFTAYKEISRVLKPGGLFILSIPLNEGLEEMIARGENPNAHVRIYTPQLIKAELEIAGFKILKKHTLYAFHNFYIIKTLIARHILFKKYLPNNIILLAQKP